MFFFQNQGCRVDKSTPDRTPGDFYPCMFTWSQLLSLLEAGNYTEPANGDIPYFDYHLDMNIDRFVSRSRFRAVLLLASTTETKSVNICVKEVIQIRGFTNCKFGIVSCL